MQKHSSSLAVSPPSCQNKHVNSHGVRKTSWFKRIFSSWSGSFVEVKLKMELDEKKTMLVDGYVRIENKLWQLNIPSDINDIIFIFLKEIIMHFSKFNHKLFNLSSRTIRSKFFPYKRFVYRSHSSTWR